MNRITTLDLPLALLGLCVGFCSNAGCGDTSGAGGDDAAAGGASGVGGDGIGGATWCNLDNCPSDRGRASCVCEGCFDVCENATIGEMSDCVCPVCADDAICSDPNLCVDGNGCDPFTEGCHCTDCASHPLCAG